MIDLHFENCRFQEDADRWHRRFRMEERTWYSQTDDLLGKMKGLDRWLREIIEHMEKGVNR